MQTKNDIHLIYRGSDQPVVSISNDRTYLERMLASEMRHDIDVCRLIQKSEIISIEVSVYGKNKREGDFKLIIEPARRQKSDTKTDNLSHSPYVIEPPCVWIGNPQRGLFKFMLKLENDSLLMRMDEDKSWFSVLYFPKTIEYYNIKFSLWRSIRTLSIRSLIEVKKASREIRKTDPEPTSSLCFCRSRP